MQHFAVPAFVFLLPATGIDNHGVARNEAAVSIEYGGKDDQRRNRVDSGNDELRKT